MSTAIPVLIVGAGPTGLTMACELLRHNIPFRIIDKKPEPTHTSNALGIQARTLEMLDAMGVVHDFVEFGQKITSACLSENKRKIIQVATQHIDSAYPYILSLPQNVTEEILINEISKRGHVIERRTELTHLSLQNQYASVELKNAAGDKETLTAQWVIACDGAHSEVRDQLNMPFDGSSVAQLFLLADLQVKSKLPRNQVHGFFSPQGLMALFPLPDERVRLIATLPRTTDTHHGIEQAAIQRLLDAQVEPAVEITQVNWLSHFWIQNKISTTLRLQNVFLLGDASHVHSPAGAQGMNTGMQDAYNLAWKIAMVTHNLARPCLLDSYEAERLPVARAVLRETSRITHIGLIKNRLLSWMRRITLRLLSRFEFLQRKFVMFVSQLALHYRNSPIIHYRSSVGRKAPQAGHRAPDVDYIDERGAPRRLAEHWRDPKHHLMLFAGKKPNAATWAALRALADLVHQRFAKTVEVIGISEAADKAKMQGWVDIHCCDTNFYIHYKYQVKQAAVYLLRPDNYLAYCSKKLAVDELNHFLQQYLLQ